MVWHPNIHSVQPVLWSSQFFQGRHPHIASSSQSNISRNIPKGQEDTAHLAETSTKEAFNNNKSPAPNAMDLLLLDGCLHSLPTMKSPLLMSQPQTSDGGVDKSTSGSVEISTLTHVTNDTNFEIESSPQNEDEVWFWFWLISRMVGCLLIHCSSWIRLFLILTLRHLNLMIVWQGS